jgi:hypothetical protein
MLHLSFRMISKHANDWRPLGKVYGHAMLVYSLRRSQILGQRHFCSTDDWLHLADDQREMKGERERERERVCLTEWDAVRECMCESERESWRERERESERKREMKRGHIERVRVFEIERNREKERERCMNRQRSTHAVYTYSWLGFLTGLFIFLILMLHEIFGCIFTSVQFEMETKMHPSLNHEMHHGKSVKELVLKN